MRAASAAKRRAWRRGSIVAFALAASGCASVAVAPRPPPAPVVTPAPIAGTSAPGSPAAGDAQRAAQATRPAPPAAGETAPAPPGPSDDARASVPQPIGTRDDASPESSPSSAPGARSDGDEALVAAAPGADAAPPVTDLWARIRHGFAMPSLDSPRVHAAQRAYLADRERLQAMLARGERYLYFIVEELEKRGLPTELALLPFVESGMNPRALSRAKAAGLWQFIPATGRRFALSQDWWVDDRRDVVRSTQAALDYLQAVYQLHGGDWFLALASYNWGENAVARAVRHNRARKRPARYEHLRMPRETREYVPRLIALKRIVRDPARYGVRLPALDDKPYFVVVERTRPIDLALAARFAGMSVEEFVALNPAHNRPVIAASRRNGIKLPPDRVARFHAAMRRHLEARKPLASWQPYTLRAHETLADVARRGRVAVAQLRQANGIATNAEVAAGSRILAPHPVVANERDVERFDGPLIYERIAQPARYHRARRGDTLASIARRYRTTVSALRRLNRGVGGALRPGVLVRVRPATARVMLTQGIAPQASSSSTRSASTRSTSSKNRP